MVTGLLPEKMKGGFFCCDLDATLPANKMVYIAIMPWNNYFYRKPKVHGVRRGYGKGYTLPKGARGMEGCSEKK